MHAADDMTRSECPSHTHISTRLWDMSYDTHSSSLHTQCHLLLHPHLSFILSLSIPLSLTQQLPPHSMPFTPPSSSLFHSLSLPLSLSPSIHSSSKLNGI